MCPCLVVFSNDMMPSWIQGNLEELISSFFASQARYDVQGKAAPACGVLDVLQVEEGQSCSSKIIHENIVHVTPHVLLNFTSLMNKVAVVVEGGAISRDDYALE